MSVNNHQEFGNGAWGVHPQNDLTGVLPGTVVLTMTGEVKIEDLKAGDRIITRNGVRVLKDVLSRTQKMQMVEIETDTCSMRVAPDQLVLLRDLPAALHNGARNMLLKISALVDDQTITQRSTDEDTSVIELQFDRQEVFYADGMEVLSAGIDADAESVAA